MLKLKKNQNQLINTKSGLVKTNNYMEKQLLLGISQLLTCLMIGPIAIYKQILQKKTQSTKPNQTAN